MIQIQILRMTNYVVKSYSFKTTHWEKWYWHELKT